jgi:hypothetical protein
MRMTAGELISILEDYDPETPVLIRNDPHRGLETYYSIEEIEDGKYPSWSSKSGAQAVVIVEGGQL